MPISLVPKFLQKAFAATGAKTDIPVNADLINGRAGYNEGFPPINMTAVAAGGIPPYGQDMNGILYDLSAAIQYSQSGVAFPFNSTFATAIGGYAAGAVVSDATDKTLLWVNGTASNTAFPGGWTSFAIKDPTETVRGMPLVATDAEARAFANDAKVLTPAKLAAAFSGSNQQTGLNGFQKLPGGFVIQRVQVATPSTAGATQPFTWPLAFAQEPGIAMAPNYGAGGILGLSVVTRNATGGSVMCGAISGTPASIAQTTIIGFGVLP